MYYANTMKLCTEERVRWGRPLLAGASWHKQYHYIDIDSMDTMMLLRGHNCIIKKTQARCTLSGLLGGVDRRE